jgi:hypothetical protein
MAYLQTTAVSISDILDSIGTFALALGWTVARNNTYTSGLNSQRILSLSLDGFDHAHFASNLSPTHTEIITMRSIGYTGTGELIAQPQRSATTFSNLFSAGAYVNLWLFGDSGSSPYIHCVLEHASGRYRHFGIGNLIKKGTWVGGGYHYGTYWDSSLSSSVDVNAHRRPFSEYAGSGRALHNSIRCDNADLAVANITGVDNRYIAYSTSAGDTNAVTTGYGMAATQGTFAYVRNMSFLDHSISSFNQRVSLLNISHFVRRAGDYVSYIGDVPDVRAVNVDPFQAQEEYSIGSDVWKIFPMVRSGTGSGTGDSNSRSGSYGIAYRKVE